MVQEVQARNNPVLSSKTPNITLHISSDSFWVFERFNSGMFHSRYGLTRVIVFFRCSKCKLPSSETRPYTARTCNAMFYFEDVLGLLPLIGIQGIKRLFVLATSAK